MNETCARFDSRDPMRHTLKHDDDLQGLIVIRQVICAVRVSQISEIALNIHMSILRMALASVGMYIFRDQHTVAWC